MIMKGNSLWRRFRWVLSRTRGEGIFSSLAAMVIVIGTLSLFITWFVLNVNIFQLQTALNLSLKRAQLEGYLSDTNITETKNYLNSVGLSYATVISPQTTPAEYGSEIQITITASTMPLPAMDTMGDAVPDANRSSELTATGYIISQYVP